MPHSRCLYDTLGIAKSASMEDVSKAFKTLALQHHPDKNPDVDTHQIFMEIKRAYEVLSDKEKRSIYDMGGMDDVETFETKERNPQTSHSNADVFLDFFLVDLLRQMHMEGSWRDYFMFQEAMRRRHSGGAYHTSCPHHEPPQNRYRYSTPPPCSPSPPALREVTVDIRCRVPGGQHKHVELKSSQKNVRVYDFDDTTPCGATEFPEEGLPNFDGGFKYKVKNEPEFSFTVNGKVVYYDVEIPLKIAHKDVRIVDMPLPNGNVLLITITGIMKPEIRYEPWVFVGEGLKGGNLVVKFTVTLPDTPEKKKKGKGKKKNK